MVLLSVQDVLKHGLSFINVSTPEQEHMSLERRIREFRKHYGPTPLDLAEQWYDLTVTDIPGAILSQEDKSMKGFKAFMIAHYFLWSKPRNAHQLARTFRVHERNAQGRPLWGWIEKIAALKAKKIKLPENVTTIDPDMLLISVDGTDCKCHEPKDPRYPVDTKMKSDKFNKSGWKYEVAMLVHKPQIVWIYGPHKGGEHDMTIFRAALKAKIATLPGSMASVDLGYRTSERDEIDLLAWPNSMDPLDVREYKSRIRCRQESLFGRLKNYEILKQTFTGTKRQHEAAFVAVAVTTQYQCTMDLLCLKCKVNGQWESNL